MVVANALLHEGEPVYYRTLADLAEIINRPFYYDLRSLPDEDEHYQTFNPLSDLLITQIDDMERMEGVKLDPCCLKLHYKRFLFHERLRDWMKQLSRMPKYADAQEDARTLICNLKKLHGQDWPKILQEMAKYSASKGQVAYEASKSHKALEQIKSIAAESLGLTIYTALAKPLISPLMDYIKNKVDDLKVRRARYGETQMVFLDKISQEPGNPLISVTGLCLDCRRVQSADQVVELSLFLGNRSVAVRAFEEGFLVESEGLENHSLEVIGTPHIRKGFLTLIPLKMIDKGACTS